MGMVEIGAHEEDIPIRRKWKKQPESRHCRGANNPCPSVSEERIWNCLVQSRTLREISRIQDILIYIQARRRTREVPSPRSKVSDRNSNVARQFMLYIE